MVNKLEKQKLVNLNKRSVTTLTVASAIAAMCGSTIVSAQEGNEASTPRILEEIVITARKRAESIQDVPITVNVLSEKTLRERGIDDIELVEEHTPGLTLDVLGGTRARPTIRGIGSDETGPGGDPSTGVFLDEVYLGRSGQQAVDAFDIQRVEVLKGPQGTLFGRNVVGGAVSFITNKPTDELGGRASFTIGEFGTFESDGHINLPASDQLKFRIAYSTKDNTGYGENEFTGSALADTQRRSIRAHALYEPSDSTSFLLTLNYTDDDANGTVGNTHRLNGVDISGDDPFTNRAEIDGFSERELFGITLKSEIELNDSLTFTNVSSYQSIEEGFLDDIDGFNRIENPEIVNVDLGFTDDATSFSTESRLSGETGKLNWTAGVYYSEDDVDGSVILRIDGTGAANVDEAFDTDLFFTATGETESIAIFAEGTYALTDQLNLTAGVRYTEDTKDFTGSFFAAGGAVEVRTESIEDVTFDDTTWRLALDYKLTDDILLYANVSTGFKSGAFPLISTVEGQFITPLEPETATNYEIGVKADFLNGLLRTNLTLFTQDFEDLQIISVSSSGDNDSLNAPEADIDGFEADLTAFLTPNFSIEARYTYLDATYGDFEFAGEVLTDSQVIRTPENDFSLSARYETGLGNGSLYILPNLSYRSRVFDDVDNNLEELRPNRTIVNLSVGWVNESGGVDLKVFVKNLTDENYFNRVSNIPGTAGQSTSGAPRHVGVQASFNF